MGSFADYAENKVLELIVGKTAFATPTVSCALSTADPTDTGSGLAEPSGNNYSRAATSGTWGTASGGSITNSGGAITFPQASGSWGTITHFALLDGSSNVLAHGQLSASKSVANGDTVQFASSAITITLD